MEELSNRDAPERGVDPRPALRRRPLLAAALCLGAGQTAAFALPTAGAALWPTATVLAAAVTGAVGVGLVGAWRTAAGARTLWTAAARRRAAVAAALALSVASAARTGWDARPPSAEDARRPIGRVEHLHGGRARLAGPDGTDWQLRFLGPAPRAGERVALLPPGEFRPSVEGPVDSGARPVPGLRRVAPDELVRLATPPRGPLARGLEALARERDRWRARVVERAGTSGATGTTGLAPALLVGSREALDPAVADLFTRTGTRHLLALSGLHVGLLAVLLLDPVARLFCASARRAGLGPLGARRLDLAGRVVGVAVFALLAGGSPPVVRAALALAAGALAGHVAPARGGDGWTEGRRPDGLSIWGAALVLEVLAGPRALADLSVSLSYAATLGILVLAGPLAQRLRRGDGVARRRRQVLRWHRPLPWIASAIVLERASAGLRASLACSLAAVLATLPIVWLQFGEVAPVGVLATVVAAPAIGVLLVAHWLAVFIGPSAVVDLAHAVEGGLLALLRAFDTWPGTPLCLPPRPPLLVALASVGTATALAFGHRRHVLVGLVALCCLASTLPGRAPAPDRAQLSVELLDVGHGTCALVRIPGLAPIVFDAGARDRPGLVSEALAPVVRVRGWRRAIVVVSHADRDHWSGLPWLSSRLAIDLWLGARPEGADRSARPAPHLDAAPAPVDGGSGRAVAGFANGARLTLLRGSGGAGNEGSRSLLVEWCGRRLLLCGDAVDAGLDAVLRAGDLEGRFDLVLLPHHGGHGSAVDRLLDTLEADRFWISAEGRPPLAAELDRRGLSWTSTSTDGPLRLTLAPVRRADPTERAWPASEGPPSVSEPADPPGARPARESARGPARGPGDADPRSARNPPPPPP